MSHILNIKVIYVRHSPYRLQCHRFRPEDRSNNPFQAILSYYDDWNVPWTAQKSLTYKVPFVFISISLKCMLSEHSSERLRFLIRKGGKNADLIGKESLWIYTVIICHFVYFLLFIVLPCPSICSFWLLLFKQFSYNILVFK